MTHHYAFPLCPRPRLGFVVNLGLAAACQIAWRWGLVPPYVGYLTAVFGLCALCFALCWFLRPTTRVSLNDDDSLRFQGIFKNIVLELADIDDARVETSAEADNCLVTTLSTRHGQVLTLDPRFTHHHDFELPRLLAARLRSRGIAMRFTEKAGWQLTPAHQEEISHGGGSEALQGAVVQ